MRGKDCVNYLSNDHTVLQQFENVLNCLFAIRAGLSRHPVIFRRFLLVLKFVENFVVKSILGVDQQLFSLQQLPKDTMSLEMKVNVSLSTQLDCNMIQHHAGGMFYEMCV
jgi:hypothetical protein